MIQLMNENDLCEIELEKDGLKVRLKKNSGGGIEQVMVPMQASPAQYAAPARAAETAAEAPKPAVNAKNVIKSPMVGTFYSSPSPEAPPFVQAGTMIEPGNVVCIIEAMKLMNEIKAEIRGKVAQVLVNNGDPVEFGQPLFILE